MKIENLKDLKDLFKLCREQGVERFSTDTFNFTLSPTDITNNRQKQPKTTKNNQGLPQNVTYVPGGVTENTQIVTMPDQLTEEQLLMWSATGTNS